MGVSLEPQDLLTTLALTRLRFESATCTYSELASTLGLSVSEANAALRRAAEAGLMTSGTKRGAKPKPVRRALLEFVEHGVRYAFFVHPGESTRGTPTAHSAPPLSALPAKDVELSLGTGDAAHGRAARERCLRSTSTNVNPPAPRFRNSRKSGSLTLPGQIGHPNRRDRRQDVRHGTEETTDVFG